MLVYEYKLDGNKKQFAAIEEAIRMVQFIRNKCLRLWMDGDHVNKNDLQIYCAVLAQEFPFARRLNSQARQASTDRAWFAISRFYENCREHKKGAKGYPTFQRNHDGATPYLDSVLAAFQKEKTAHVGMGNQTLPEPLSKRELQVLQLLAHGSSNLEIAQKLVITVDTDKRHVSHIFSKFGVRNRLQAVKLAIDLDILASKHNDHYTTRDSSISSISSFKQKGL